MILTPAVGPAARAGAELRSFNRIGPVITINSGNDPIFKINTQETPPAAIMRRTAGANHPLAGRRGLACRFIRLFLPGSFYFFENCAQLGHLKIYQDQS